MDDSVIAHREFDSSTPFNVATDTIHSSIGSTIFNHQTKPSVVKHTCNPLVPEYLQKPFGTPHLENHAIKFDINTLNHTLNGMRLLEKYQFAYGLARNVEMDFNLSMGPNMRHIPIRIMERTFFE
ncbi:hypothetical protein RF11_13053 [Thelohanellus kitauei]|uniref:Uncharacterized protein n=1 Tax=Thelohanellus kitauei TaxID=669202 RepID=A0A0C2N7C8_THEKT|nr:hypothetical protein RF11_13053 [Thelohanellus kitauei]